MFRISACVGNRPCEVNWKKLLHRHVRPRVLDRVTRARRPVGDLGERVAARRLGAVHRVRVRAHDVDGVAPERQVRVAEQRRERDGGRRELPQSQRLREDAWLKPGQTFVRRIEAGEPGQRRQLLHVGVGAVDEEAPVRRVLVEAVAGLQIRDPMLLEVGHERGHRVHGRLAVPVVEVHVDVHAAPLRRSPVADQSVFSQKVGVGAVAKPRVVDAEDEARHALEQHAVLGVDRHVHRRARRRRHLRDAIRRIVIDGAVARQVDERDGREGRSGPPASRSHPPWPRHGRRRPSTACAITWPLASSLIVAWML